MSVSGDLLVDRRNRNLCVTCGVNPPKSGSLVCESCMRIKAAHRRLAKKIAEKRR